MNVTMGFAALPAPRKWTRGYLLSQGNLRLASITRASASCTAILTTFYIHKASAHRSASCSSQHVFLMLCLIFQLFGAAIIWLCGASEWLTSRKKSTHTEKASIDDRLDRLSLNNGIAQDWITSCFLPYTAITPPKIPFTGTSALRLERCTGILERVPQIWSCCPILPISAEQSNRHPVAAAPIASGNLFKCGDFWTGPPQFLTGELTKRDLGWESSQAHNDCRPLSLIGFLTRSCQITYPDCFKVSLAIHALSSRGWVNPLPAALSINWFITEK